MHAHAPMMRDGDTPGATLGARHRMTQGMAIASVLVALCLIGMKAWAWFVSGSVSMLASLADSSLDLVASLFTLFAVRYAATPPDAEHRYGHGKAEAVAALFQAGLVAISAALIAVEAISRAVRPEPITQGAVAIGVIGVSLLLTAALVAAQSWAVRRTGSLALHGDRAHYLADLGGNVAVIAGIVAGAFFGLTWADAGMGFLIAAWLGWSALGVARAAADQLLDRELPEAERERIRALARSQPGLLDVHDLRTRSSGAFVHIQFHADLDPALSLRAAHAIVVEAEGRIRAHYPGADIIIHADPADAQDRHGHALFGERRAEP